MSTIDHGLIESTWAITEGRSLATIAAKCSCGVSVEHDIATKDLPEFPSDGEIDTSVAGMLARRLAGAMQLEGCVHANRDPKLLAATLFRPERPRLIRALEVITGLSTDELEAQLGERASLLSWGDGEVLLERSLREDHRAEMGPAEAWEFMASREIIPFSWMGDSRSFLASRADGTIAPTPEPPTLRAAVTIASNAEGIEQAEELAKEVLSRLASWGVPQPSTLVWRIVDPARGWKPSRPWYWKASLKSALIAASPMLERVPAASPAWWDLAALDARSANVWDAASSAGHRFDGMPNPYDPALVLWMLGYTIERIDEDAMVLVAPEI